MAKKKATKKVGGRRKRRTSTEMIRDLQRQIAEVKERAAARELKQSPVMKRTITIMRSMNKAMDEAASEKNGALRHALADAFEPLAVYLRSQGLQSPKTRKPRGRRPKV